MNRYLTEYLILPARLLIKNWSIFILFFVFLIISNVYSRYSSIEIKINPLSVYENLLPSIFSLFKNKVALLVVVSCFLGMSYLIVGIGKDMLMIFTRQRKSLFDSMKKIKLNDFIWFLKLEFYLYLIFGSIGMIFYGLTYLLWKETTFQYLPVIILGIIFALLYPLFYIGLSLGSMFSVLPLKSSEKFNKFRYFLVKKALFRTYFFYSARLVVEYIFIIGLPFISIYFFKSIVFANVFVLIGLAFPLLVLRGSAYEFKLKILSNDEDFKKIFYKHYSLDNEE